MPRTVDQSLADLEMMVEAVERLKHVMYAKPFYERRYQDALGRVIHDLGDPWTYMHKAVDDREDLVKLLRAQFN